MLSDIKPLNNNTYEMNVCNRKSSIQFNSNETFHRISYFSLAGNCKFESDEKGTYVYDSANHKITIKFEDIYEGEQIEIWNNVEIIGNTFSYTWQEDDIFNSDDWNIVYRK